MPLSLLAYFLTHIDLNGGIVTLKRSRYTRTERLWVPSPQNIGQGVSRWIQATFNLPYIFDLVFTTGGEASSGVGLALIKLILSASGAKVNCHTRHGDKDTFTAFVITFPHA